MDSHFANRHPAKPGDGSPFASFPFVEDFDEETEATPSAIDAVDAGMGRGDAEPQIPAIDLVEMRASAYAEGRRDERACIVTEQASAERQTLATIAAHLDEAATAAMAAADAAAEETAKLLLRVLSSLLPNLCARHGAGEAAGLVRAVVPALAHEPHIVIRVSPHVRAEVEAELELVTPERGLNIEVIATDAVAPGDARISWDSGAASRSIAELWNDVAARLAPLGLFDELHSPPAPTCADLTPKVPQHV